MGCGQAIFQGFIRSSILYSDSMHSFYNMTKWKCQSVAILNANHIIEGV